MRKISTNNVPKKKHWMRFWFVGLGQTEGEGLGALGAFVLGLMSLGIVALWLLK